jgi:predicted transglutaminase-like cysteine proteinase
MNNHFAAPPENEIARPTPAVVIAVGRFAAQAACQVQNIYLRGDARRAAASAFYRLQPDETTGLALVELSQGVSAESQTTSGSFLEQRQAALQGAIEHVPALKSRLERLLHEQRIQERLMAAGWAEIYDVPLNFFILADVNDPWAAGALLPLGAILNELLANSSLCQAHWLLCTAVFPESEPDQDLAVWSFLQAFDDFLRPESEQREELAKALKLQYRQAPDFAVYLFDSRKEGTAMVKDPASLGTLFGNALLALLQRDLARRFFQERDEDALIERGSYYSSIGAAGLVYDPDALQAACAQRIGHAFLTEKILCTARDGQAAIQYTHQLQEKLGGLYAWLESLCVQLPQAVGQVLIQPDTLEMAALLTDIALAKLDYERVNQTPWAEQLQGYQARFEQETLPDVSGKLETNCQQLETRLGELLQATLDRLPLEADLYPGGLHNARRVLDLTTESLEKITKDLETLAEKVQERQSVATEKLAAQRQQMQALLSDAPALPWWVRILPSFARQWLAPIYLARYYGQQLYQAQALRDACLALLQQLCGLRIEQQALDQIKNILPGLQAQVQEAKTALAALEEKLSQAGQAFASEWGEFPLAEAVNGWDALFRQPVTDRSLANWAYDQWLPDLDAWVHAFLAARPLFADWRSVEPGAVASWVQDQAAQTYQPVWSLDLEAIFALWAVQTPGFGAEKPLTAKTITTCMNAAFPPVRPDFDAVGGASGSSVTFHGLTGDPKWQHCCLPPAQNGAVRWQPVYTGDPYTALFIQVRRNVPLRSLSDSFQIARLRLEGLPHDQRSTYQLLQGLNKDGPPIMETVDPNSPDLAHKTFQWKFQPKGSNKEIEQTIELAISRSLFEYYRRQPRYNGQWNLYAELEMPEVRELASEFQKLHARHKWNTFNQAYNVLKFVQSCVPYSYDKDTTGHEDWARYPIETLMEGTGDCEDLAILCAAVIARLGFQVVLLVYPKHVAFGVAGADNLKGDYILDPKTGFRYFYGEATANGWHLGEIPREFTSTEPEKILAVNIWVCE